MRSVAVVTLAWSFLAAGVTWAANLLPNGDFEQGEQAPAGWSFTVFSSKPSRGTWEWATEARSGQRAVRLIGVGNAGDEAARYLAYSQPVTVREGMYRLRGWYRTEGAARGQLQIPIYTGDFAQTSFGTPAQDTLYHRLEPTAEWAPFEVEINVKAGAEQVVVMLRGSDVGAILYDDVSLEAVDDVLSVKLYAAEYGRANTLFLVKDAPNFFRLMLFGDRARIEQGAEVLIDLPQGVGDFGLIEQKETVTRDGAAYTRYHVPVTADKLGSMTRTVSHCAITVWVDTGSMPETGTIYYRAVADGQAQEERQAAVKVLPPMPDGAPPKRFANFYCWSAFGDVPEPLWPAVYDMLRNMGVSHHLARALPEGWREYLQRRLSEDGGKLWADIPHQMNKEMAVRGWETRIIAQGKGFFSFADEYYGAVAPIIDGVFWDYEPANAMHNPLFDDAPTVAAFAQKEGLDPATLTQERLQGELRERFLAFRTWQLGEVLRLWAQYIHDIRPDLEIAVCQGSGMPPGRNVDYRVYDDIPKLIHLPMIYTSSAMSFAQNVAGLHDYVPNTPLIPMTCTGMLADGGWLAAKTPRAIYFDYVTSGLRGCAGCSHWPDIQRGLDMEYIRETALAVQEIACVEDFLTHGEASPAGVSVEPLPEQEARIKAGQGDVVIMSPQWDKHAISFSYRLGEQTLVAVCNMHPDTPATVRVRIRDAEGDGWYLWDPASRALLAPDAGDTWDGLRLSRAVLYEAPASSTGMLVASREAPAEGFSSRVAARDVEQRFEQRKAAAQAAGDISVVRDGELEIGWEDMDGDGNAEVRLASGKHALGIGPSGNLWSWQVAGHEGDLVNRFDGSGACEDRFWWPEDARTSDDGRREYELVTREVKGGRASVTFRRELAHWSLGGLVLDKTYSIGVDAPIFEVSVTIRNSSPVAHEFSYWSHNCLNAGGIPALTLSTTAGEQVFSGGQQPREVWMALKGTPADQADLAKSTQDAQLAAPMFTLGDPAGPRIRVTADASLLQLYRWWDGTDGGRYTLEWMHQRQTLDSGRLWTTRYTVEYAE